jgi:tyrosine-protein kinase Etk/Wzc
MAKSRTQPPDDFTDIGSAPGGEEFDMRQVFDLLWSNRNIVLLIAALFLLLGAAYVVLVTPAYKADGLLQIEKDSKADALGSAAMGDISSMLLGATTETQAEIQIVQSRLVLGDVIKKEGLLISAKPRHFPLIGDAVARFNKKKESPVAAPWGFRSYGWGGEKILVTTFDVPDDLMGKKFTLVTNEHGYSLRDPSGNQVLDGDVGEASSGVIADYGPVSIFVQSLRARPGTKFTLVRRSEESVLEQIDKQMSVLELGNKSGVIQVTYKAPSAAEAADFINSLEDSYLRQNVERRSAEAQQSLTFLNEQLPELKDKVDEAQAKLNAYQLTHGTVDVTEETADVLHQNVELDTRRLELEQQRKEALQRFTPEHPVVKALDQQLQLLEAAQGSAKKEIEKLPSTQQSVLALMRDVDVATQLYTAMLDSVQQLQVAKAGTIGSVRILDRPLVPRKPVSPKTAVVLALAAALGLVFGVAFVVVRRHLLRGIDDPVELERRFGLLTYASIPYSSTQRRLAGLMSRGRSQNYVLALTRGDELVAEAFASLKTSLHFALVESPNNVLMITGPSPGLGKTFISINLAASLALSGKKVMLIDADLRRGHVHRYFGVEARPGISDFVAGDVEKSAIIQKTAQGEFDYIVRGTSPPNPTELLLNERFSMLIDELSAQYDFVIFDSPPVLPVADAAILGRLAGCTLMALKAAEHPAREIEETLRRLANARVTVKGIILNQVGAKVGSHGYGGYGYTYYNYEKIED